MRFGVREICEVSLKALATMKVGSRTFYKNDPVLYFDTLKTSTLEGASTTVYATGGRGNSRLIAWEGERTLTFTMEDALISPESFSVLAGADLIAPTEEKPIYQHMVDTIEVKEPGKLIIPDAVVWNGGRVNPVSVADANKHPEADFFATILDDNNQQVGEPLIPSAMQFEQAQADGTKATVVTLQMKGTEGTCVDVSVGTYVFVDYYVKRTAGAQQIEITPESFGGNFYLEASTLFRDEATGKDMPAEFIIPNCKIQSNFTFSMASSGDPSTFTFTLDAFPGYLKFDRSHKVLAAIQIIEDATGESDAYRPNACATAGE